MIESFIYKGIEKFFLKGSTAGIQAKHARKLKQQLTFLHTAKNVRDMDVPGWRLHELTGDKKGIWSVTVSGNWRMIFQFENGNAYIVNYEDYH